MRKLLFYFIWFFLLLLYSHSTWATHIKAGEIVIQRTADPLTFNIILTVYTDSISVANGVDDPTATITIFDPHPQAGQPRNDIALTVPRSIKVSIGNATYRNVYTTTYKFPGNDFYKIGYTESNRNDKIVNISNSVNTPFYIETSIFVSSFVGANNSPQLLFPPIDQAESGEIYVHNPGAYDPEGDSISFKMTVPKKDKDQEVTGYRNPDDPAFGSGSNFNLNPITGDLVWNTPITPGLYNVAFLIEEWRNGIRIGYVTRDMQIEVLPPSPNKPPVIVPIDTCITAGVFLNIDVTATDPNNDKINLTTSNNPPSGVYSLGAKFTLNGSNPQNFPASGIFEWRPSCNEVREQEYSVIFKAEDVRPNGKNLVDIENFLIKVSGPAPLIDSVVEVTNGMGIFWSNYSCSNADSMVIYRKECDTTNYTPDPCVPGLPGFLGYHKIGSTPINTRSFIDTNNIQKGSFYCYVLVAIYPAPKKGSSFPSNEFCAGPRIDVPLITNVTVDVTDSVNGKVTVRWVPPVEIPSPGPYQYILQRADSADGGNYTTVQTFFSLSDTVFVDSMLNTLRRGYHYKILFFNNSNLAGASPSASSPYLTGRGGNNIAFLGLDQNVPWKVEQIYIYKGRQPDNISLYDSTVFSGSFNYQDHQVANCDTFYYRLQVKGRYCDNAVPYDLINFSEVIRVIPTDSIPPPAPELFIQPVNCTAEKDIKNELSWKPGQTSICNVITGYKLYYSQYENDSLDYFASVTDTFFIDVDTISLSGCYAVSAINQFGIEGEKSNKVCVDNCFYYALPNLITPNNDEKNDLFKPLPEPVNVEKVKFYVYNRWGKLVHYQEDDIFLNWDGHGLSDGVYFYLAEVKFIRRLRKEDEIMKLKGWVQILR